MKYLAIDIETVGLNPWDFPIIWICSFNDGKKVTVEHDCFGNYKFFAKYKKVLEDPNVCKVIHNASFDGTYIKQLTGITIRNIWDTQLMEQIIVAYQLPPKTTDETLLKQYSTKLNYTLPRYGLPVLNKDLRKNFIGRPKGTKFTKEELNYAMDDVRWLLKLQRAQEYILTRDNQMEVAMLENETVYKTIGMRWHGVGFSKPVWSNIADKNELQYNKLQRALPNTVANWGSQKQVKEYFRSKGINLQTYDQLPDLKARHNNKVLNAFMDWQAMQKSVTTYGRNWFDEGYIKRDGRVHGDFRQIVNTGRFSSSNPNLQNLPAEGLHRSAFVGNFVIGDFSGQEMAIMAAQADEKIWLDALLRGDDIHAITARALFPGDWDEGHERNCAFPKKCFCKTHVKLRKQTKVLNFMLAYGGGPEKFSEDTGLSMLDSTIIVRRYKKVVPNTTRWLERNGRDALINGISYSADPYRRRRLLKANEDWQIVNQGKNNPVQGAGANMLKLSMISIPDAYPIAIVIHDEIALDIQNPKQNKQAVTMLRSVMESSADYITGIKGLVKAEPRIATNLLKV